MHGDRTHAAHIKQLQTGLPEPAEDRPAAGERASAPLDAHLPGPDGKHRLKEDREQHDDADIQSDKNRAAREGIAYSSSEPEPNRSSDPRAS
jgi:hypothetical protein